MEVFVLINGIETSSRSIVGVYGTRKLAEEALKTWGQSIAYFDPAEFCIVPTQFLATKQQPEPTE